MMSTYFEADFCEYHHRPLHSIFLHNYTVYRREYVICGNPD